MTPRSVPCCRARRGCSPRHGELDDSSDRAMGMSVNREPAHCGENCDGLIRREAVTGTYRRKSCGLRSAVNVNGCMHAVTGALPERRIHNPKVGSSSLPPATTYLPFQSTTYRERLDSLSLSPQSFCRNSAVMHAIAGDHLHRLLHCFRCSVGIVIGHAHRTVTRESDTRSACTLLVSWRGQTWEIHCRD
jgi:hypothetical protein